MTYEVLNEHGDLLGWIKAHPQFVQRQRVVSFAVVHPIVVHPIEDPWPLPTFHRLDLRVEQFYNAGAQPRVALVVEDRMSGLLAKVRGFKLYE